MFHSEQTVPQSGNSYRAASENRAALPYEQIPEFIVSLIENRSAGALAVAFSILTATRFKAVRLAEWSEFNLNNPIPASVELKEQAGKLVKVNMTEISPDIQSGCEGYLAIGAEDLMVFKG